MKDKLRTLIFEAIGEASMCWEFPEKAGIFQSRKAEQIGIKLLDEISLLLQSAPPCGGITKGEI